MNFLYTISIIFKKVVRSISYFVDVFVTAVALFPNVLKMRRGD